MSQSDRPEVGEERDKREEEVHMGERGGEARNKKAKAREREAVLASFMDFEQQYSYGCSSSRLADSLVLQSGADLLPILVKWST